jgi:hypothetical protein
MLIGVGLDVLREFPVPELLSIFQPQKCDVLDYGLLYRGSATKAGMESAECGIKMLEYLKSGISFPGQIPGEPNILDLASFVLNDRFGGRFSYSIFSESSFTHLLKRAATADHLQVLSEMLNDVSRQARRNPHTHDWQDQTSAVISHYLGPCWLATRSTLTEFLRWGLRETDYPSCDFLDSSKPLVERLASAWLHRSDAAWWEESLSGHLTSNDSQILAVSLVCMADEQTISALLPQISRFVSDWAPEQVVAILDTVPFGNATRSRLNVRKMDLAEVSSPALLGAVAGRLRLDQRQQLLATAIGHVDDERIRQALAERLLDTCVARISSTGRWVGTKESINQFGNMISGSRYSAEIWGRRDAPRLESLDAAAANGVIREAGKFPPELVTLADRSALERVSSSVPLVSEVAIRDHWFDHEQPF